MREVGGGDAPGDEQEGRGHHQQQVQDTGHGTVAGHDEDGVRVNGGTVID